MPPDSIRGIVTIYLKEYNLKLKMPPDSFRGILTFYLNETQHSPMPHFACLIFIAIVFFCWGTYGPTLHQGQSRLGADGQISLLRPIICVGIAYFLIAVVYPILMLGIKGEKGKWSIGGFYWSFIAGALGAFGALGITLAFKFQGRPIYVMPLVFGLAPIVNTLVTMTLTRTLRNANSFFYLGILIVAIGAAGVLISKPSTAKSTPATSSHETPQSENEPTPISDPSPAAPYWPMIVLGIATTASCWGAYGPILHRGQAKMDGSRLRPFLCVGLAYFAIAVVVPYFALQVWPEPGGWFQNDGGLNSGVLWSLGGGALGAIGALGIIYAFNFGGKPIFVMPLVFGFAPVVNTLVETTSKGLLNEISLLFYISLAAVIFGAVMVLVFAPKAAPAKTADT